MKKIIPLLLAVLLLISSSIYVSAEETYRLGDVNKDGLKTITDATLVQCYVAGYYKKTDEIVKLADVDADGILSIVDATNIQLYTARYIDKFPGETVKPTVPSTDPDGYYDQIIRP